MNIPSVSAVRPARSVEELTAAPEKFLDLTITEMHSIPNGTLQEIHTRALSEHFTTMVERVPVLALLAEEQHIHQVREIAQAGPLLLSHSVYKSYPLSVLENGRFDRLTRWLDKLTAHDLSALDASACGSIDEWIDFLDANTELRIKHSSGTTGKLSFVPRSVSEMDTVAKGFMRFFEGFGDEPDAHLRGFDSLPIIHAGYRHGAMGQARLLDAVTRYFHGGDDSWVTTSNPGRLSADVLSLGGRIKGAEQRGELGKLKLAPGLLARRDAFEKEQAHSEEHARAFFDDVATRLRGRRVVISGTVPQLADLAEEGRKQGVMAAFARDSLVHIAGGSKGRVLPDRYRELIVQFIGIDRYPRLGYGMTEMVNATHRACPLDHYHFRPNIVPFIIDPQTGEQLPRQGTQTGRFGFVDLAIKTHWGGFLTGDEVTLSFGDTPCACGRTGAHVDPVIRRYSEAEGGDDKITCAGAPDAHNRALDFITRVAE
jgi:hypothetical protein